MQDRLQPQLAIIRRQQRLGPVLKPMTSYTKEEKVRLALVASFFVIHVPLAFLMAVDQRIATLHAVVTIAVAVWLAVFSKTLERVAYAGAYITGAEVLWRMTYAESFWETGKYAVAMIFLIAMLRNWRGRSVILPILYFLLLLPSVLLTVQSREFSEIRSFLSSDMSGPFALMVASCFFSQFSLSKESLLRMFLALMGPIIGVASVALIWIRNVESLVFTNDSNVFASGGFGPNQVSAILGLGALAGFLVLLDRGVSIKLKLLCGASYAVSCGSECADLFARWLIQCAWGYRPGLFILAKGLTYSSPVYSSHYSYLGIVLFSHFTAP